MTTRTLHLPRRAPVDRERPFVVRVVKGDGRRVLFQRYPTRAAAQEVVAALSRMKCRAEIEGPDDDEPRAA